MCAPVRQHILAAKPANRLLVAGDIAAERLIAPHGAVEQEVHQVRRRVFGLAQFLEDHPPLLFDIPGVEARAQKHIGQHIHRAVEMDIGDFSVVDGRLEAGICIQNAADALDRVGDQLGGWASLAALEQQMLDEVRDPVVRFILIAGSDVDPHSDRDRPDMAHLFGHDPDAVRQHRLPVQRHGLDGRVGLNLPEEAGGQHQEAMEIGKI